MTLTIKLTTDQIRLMSLFQNVTKTNAHDCIDDVKKDRIIFVVNEGNMGLAIGKNGSNIKSKLVNEVKLNTMQDGSLQATVIVDQNKKGLVVGREGRNAEKARLLSKRYFNITNILIHSHTPQLEI